MLLNIRGKRLWIVDETGQATPVKRPADIHQRPRGRHLPDWWVEEKSPDWRPEAERETSLLRLGQGLGMTQNEDDARRSARRWPDDEPDFGPGGWPGADPGEDSGDGLDPDPAPPAGLAGGLARGMKIGAGHKPQAYDAFGRYTGPRGGAMPIGGGKVRLFGVEALAGDSGGEAGQEELAEGLEGAAEAAIEAAAEAMEQAEEQAQEIAQETAEASAQTLPGVLVADSGRIVSDAGGGWDNEARRLEEKRFTPERLARNARADIGSDRWKPIQEGSTTKNQCNVFVVDKLRESGAPVPNVGGVSGKISPELSDSLHDMTGGRVGGSPPSASDWHEGRVPGFEPVKGVPQPGDIASNGDHVGIVSGARSTISVTTRGENSGHVVENDWGFRDRQKPVTFWRYRQPNKASNSEGGT